MDYHSHASKKGCFVYGNNLDFWPMVESTFYTKLLSMNCVNFDFKGSSFSPKLNQIKDKKGDQLSRESSSRAQIYKCTNITHCYTLECNYFTGKEFNILAKPFNHITDETWENNWIQDCTNPY